MSASVATGKRFRRGTHRVRSPEETWAWIRDLLPRAGVTRVADVTGLDALGIPVWQAVRPASRNLSVSQGKGATPEAARVSAAMEALELWHAEDLGHLPQVVMSPQEMRSSNPIPLAALRWSSAGIPGGIPVSWVRARAFPSGRPGWLPRRMLEIDFHEPESFSPRLFDTTSNGLASGNCLEEALLHGVCELVERHALFLAGREPGRRIPLDPESIGLPWFQETLARWRGRSLKMALRDLTWEAGVPVVVADLALPDLPHVWRGSGCHPSPDVALSRAVTEAAQSRLTYISGARDDLPELPAALDGHRTFAGFEEPRGGRPFRELPDRATSDVAADLAEVVRSLAGLGFATFYVDLTREEIGVPVVTAFIPGLRELPHD